MNRTNEKSKWWFLHPILKKVSVLLLWATILQILAFCFIGNFLAFSLTRKNRLQKWGCWYVRTVVHIGTQIGRYEQASVLVSVNVSTAYCWDFLEYTKSRYETETRYTMNVGNTPQKFTEKCYVFSRLLKHYLGMSCDLLAVVCDWVASLNTDQCMVSYLEYLFSYLYFKLVSGAWRKSYRVPVPVSVPN